MHRLFCIHFLWQSFLFFAPGTTTIQQLKRADFAIHAPQKFTAGEQTEIIVVVKNKIKTEWTGYVSLELQDKQSKQNIDGLFANIFPSQYFTVSATDSSVLLFPVSIPQQFHHSVLISAKLFDRQKCSDSLTIVVPF